MAARPGTEKVLISDIHSARLTTACFWLGALSKGAVL